MRDEQSFKAITPGAQDIFSMANATDQPEKVLQRVITSKKIDTQSIESDLSALYGILDGLAKKTVVVVFAMGKILTQVKHELPHGQFLDFIRAKCPFSEDSAQNYMRIYKHYKDLPPQELEDMSLGHAYAEAGIKKLAAPKKNDKPPSGGPDNGPVDFGLPKVEEFDRILKTQPASGITLKYYRVASFEDGRIHAIRQELGAFLVADLYLPRFLDKPEARLVLEEATKNVCIALEMYYAKIEQLEDKGLLPTPEDLRFTTAIRRASGVSGVPEKQRSKKRRV